MKNDSSDDSLLSINITFTCGDFLSFEDSLCGQLGDYIKLRQVVKTSSNRKEVVIIICDEFSQ